jgi:peptidoglycan-associated lipoprotein
VAVILSAGCGTDDAVESDSIKGGALPGDFAMGNNRDVEGTRITDVQFESVFFKYDSPQIQESETAKMEKVAEYMRKNAGVRVVAEGHCDERGSNEYNMSLGESRALAVRATLIRLGVDNDKVQTRSFGEERPADPRHSEDGWRLNRRVEFALYK